MTASIGRRNGGGGLRGEERRSSSFNPASQTDRPDRGRAPRVFMALWRFLPPSSSSALFFTFHVGWMSESIEEEATAWAPRRKEERARTAWPVLPPSPPPPSAKFSSPLHLFRFAAAAAALAAVTRRLFPPSSSPSFLRSPRISFTVALVSVSVIRSMRHGGLFVKAIEEEGDRGRPSNP